MRTVQGKTLANYRARAPGIKDFVPLERGKFTRLPERVWSAPASR